MKNIFSKYAVATVLIFSLNACGKDFLEQTPLDQITVDNFYQNTSQIDAFTATLYGFPWFDLNDKSIYAIGDIAGGNAFTFDGAYDPFLKFSVRQDNPRLTEAWNSLFKVVSFSNSVINTLPKKAPASVDPSVVNRAVGEAKFMRALAYFYLVRIWGAVPIVENSEALATGEFRVPRHRVEDIYKFMISDLQASETACPLSYGGANKGRVTSGAAKSLLAKIYLYQKDYPNARKKAEEVVNSGAYTLVPNFGDVFKQKNNNNSESVFAWQWVACPDCWGQQNTLQAYFAASGQGITETGDGWGSVMPSLDLINAFEKDDRRKKVTIMTAGDDYPELTSKNNPTGYKYPNDKRITATGGSIRKYVVGSPIGADGPVYFMRTGINTNILRYSEVLLIHAEAVLAGGASSTDAAGLASFNKVRARAGLTEKGSMTQDDIFKERRVELAFEHDLWFDLGRLDRAKAKDIISKQERGTLDGPFAAPLLNSVKAIITDKDFLMPIPQQEADRNPKLLEEPIPYK